MKKIDLETLLRKFLPYYLILIYFSTICGAFYYFLVHHTWVYGDWLTNYQGGFVRRGFIGEVIYQIAIISKINPGFIAFIIISIIYAFIFYLSYKLLKMQDKLLPYTFLIFSPFIFKFHLISGGYRKEILYLAALCFFAYLVRTRNPKFNLYFYVFLSFIYPLFILSHEITFVFIPYFLITYFIFNNKPNYKLLTLTLIPSFLALLSSIMFSKLDMNGVNDIYTSLEKLGYSFHDKSDGSIVWLSRDIEYAFNFTINAIVRWKYYYYIFVVILAMIAYIPVANRISQLFDRKLYLGLILLSFILSLPLFIFAIDWGRWIYIHLFSIFLLTLLFKEQDRLRYFEVLSRSTLVFLILVFVYSSFYRVPHIMNYFIAKSFKDINTLRILKSPVYVYWELRSRNWSFKIFVE